MSADKTCSVTSGDWISYYEAVAGTPPRDTLVTALDAWEAEFPDAADKHGVDLGCGEGRDTVEFLRRGWRVLAVDSEPAALAWLRGRDDLPATGALTTRLAAIEDTDWDKADVVNASFVLPFCPPPRFDGLWRRIVASLRPGGRFAGNLFGPDDTWAGPDLTIVTRGELDDRLAPFELDHFEEINRDGEDAKGLGKHWHLFSVVGRRRGDP